MSKIDSKDWQANSASVSANKEGKGEGSKEEKQRWRDQPKRKHHFKEQKQTPHNCFTSTKSFNKNMQPIEQSK